MYHPTEEEIALFVDGKFDDIDDIRVAKHLRECSSCHEDYLEAVRGKGLWIADKDQFRPSRDLVQTGLVAAKQTTKSGQPNHGMTAVRMAATIVTASVVVVAFVWIWFAVGDRGNGGTVIDQAVEPVFRAAVLVSSRTDFVLPRTEDVFRPDAPAYRSNLAIDDESLSTALTDLADKRNAGLATRDDQFWLVSGFVAADKLDEAETCVNDALREYSGNSEFLTLAAVIACFQGDCERADRVLREVVRQDPSYYTARLNLAVVLIKTGNRPEAEKQVKKILRDRPDTGLAERAEMLLR